MIAVYKRELRSYLTSMIGYLFIFFILLLTGIYFSAYQLSGGYSKFETTLPWLQSLQFRCWSCAFIHYL